MMVNSISHDDHSLVEDPASSKAFLSDLLFSAEVEKTILEIISTTLDFSHTERHPLCLYSLAHIITRLFDRHISSPYINKDFAEHFQKAYPDFVNSVLDFLVRQQNLETIQAMIKTLRVCRCDEYLDNPEITQLAHPPPSTLDDDRESRVTVFAKLTARLWRLLTFLTGNLTRVKVDRMKERKKVRPKDAGCDRLVYCLGTDPESLGRAIFAWFKQTSRPEVIEFFFEARRIQRHGAERALVTVPALARYIQDSLSRCMTALVDPLRSTHNQSVPFGDALMFLHLLCADFSESVRTSFFQPHARTMYLDTLSMFTHIHEAGVSPGSNKIRTELCPLLAQHAFRLHSLLPESMRDRCPLPQRINNFRLLLAGESMFSIDNPHLFVAQNMHLLEKARICLNLTCGNLPPLSIKSWKRCSRCKIVSYCSEACQRAAWVDAVAPPKDLCQDWSILRPVWPPVAHGTTSKDPIGDGMKAIDDIYRAKAVPLGYGESKEIEVAYDRVSAFVRELQRRFGLANLQG